VSFLTRRVIFRLRGEELAAILKTCSEHADIYFNPSHFIRVAIMREIDRNRRRK